MQKAIEPTAETNSNTNGDTNSSAENNTSEGSTDANSTDDRDSSESEIPPGWVKDTTALLYGLGKVTYVVPEYFIVPQGQMTSHDRYYLSGKKSLCHLSITGKEDIGGAQEPADPLSLKIPGDAKYHFTQKDIMFLSAKLDNGLEFWMKINKSEYAEQCGKDFVGFLNSIKYTPAQ